MALKWWRSRRMAWVTALAAALLLAGLAPYRQFGPSELVTCANDPALVRRIIRETAKAAGAIRNGQGRLTSYEWFGFPDGSTKEQQSDISVSFSGGVFRFRQRDIYCRYTKARRSLRGRVQRAWTQLLDPHYSNWSCDDRIVACDGRRSVLCRPSYGKAYLYPADHGLALSALAVDPVIRGSAVAVRGQGTVSPALPGGSAITVSYSEPVLIGRQLVDGSECLVVEQNQVVRLPSGGSGHTMRFWVCPAKGYSVVRTETWMKNATQLLLRCNARMRLRNGIWAPLRREVLQYGGPGHGRYGVTQRRISTLDPNFQFNLPARKLNLSLRLPRGTKVHDEVLKKDYVVK